MSVQAIADRKQYYIVTGINFVSVDIELFSDPLAYGRAIQETQRQHDRGEIEAWTCGDNMVNFDKKNPIYGGLYIATMAGDGATAQFFADENEYLTRLLDLKEEEYYQRVDAMDYNGPDIDFDPDATDEDDLDDEDMDQPVAPSP
ncbi:hypothetical protein G6L37_04540 [Agrobacterium rubi]|nr:hypothetical protein [Agrobacterium rubi]NTF24621.1 hypothetical protein [Agrobacterium rubi]